MMNDPRKRDARIPVALMLATFFLLVLWQDDRGQESGAVPATFDLTWTGGGLVLSGQQDDVTPGPVPAQIAPLFFERIPVNTADAPLLETIPGIGPHLAAQIIEGRRMIGRYRNPDDLLRVPGIGLKRKEKLQDTLSFD